MRLGSFALLDPAQLALNLPDWWCVRDEAEGAAGRGRPGQGLLDQCLQPWLLPAPSVFSVGTA